MKKVILLLSTIEIVAFFIIVIRFDLGFDQIMSLFGRSQHNNTISPEDNTGKLYLRELSQECVSSKYF